MIISKLYGNLVELGFNPSNHRYFWRRGNAEKSDGSPMDWQRAPGVTDCLQSAASPGLEKWKIKCAVEYLKDWVVETSRQIEIDGVPKGLVIDEIDHLSS